MKRLLLLWRDFWTNPWQARFTLPLVVINLLGSCYGYYWYREQLAATPVYFWPFVPDSPLSTTLLALALLVRQGGAGSLLFQTVAFTASIKYGIWAVLLISHYWQSGGPVALTEGALWLSHLGMAAQGAIYLRGLRPEPGVILLTGAWMAVNDLLDYGLGLHPYLFAAGQDRLAFLTAAALTVLLAGALWLGRIRPGLRLG